MKGVFVILDGLGDEPCQSLGQKTPLEAANTPNLDEIAKRSKIDYCYTVKKDYVPGSEQGVISLLGYDYAEADRGPLEALGLGIKLTNGDLALRCNFSTIDDLENRHVLDRRAGRTLTTKEAQILAKAINDGVKLNSFNFRFYSNIQHRGVLVIKGGFSNNITSVDRDFKSERVVFSEALDDVDDSNLAASVVNNFVTQAFKILDKHPINFNRARKGLFSANFLLCRGAGNKPAKFKKLRGKWMALGYMPLEIGIARATGMSVYSFKYPKLKDIDVYKVLYNGLEKAIKNSIKMLKKNKKKIDYFYVHIKECDLPGHDNKPHDKVKMIEILDKKLFSFLRKFIGNERLVITADHATACRRKGHTADPVPVLTYPHPKGEVKEKRFTEEEGMKGRKILGKKLLEENFFRR